MIHRTLRTALLATVVTASGAAAQSAALPHLVPAFTTTQVDLSPVNRLTPLAVGPQGSVLFVSNTTPNAKLVLVDSTGKELARFGHPGEGPGELQSASPITVTREGVGVWDGNSSRYSEWDLKGVFKRSVTPSQTLQLFDLGATDLLGAHYDPKGSRPLAVNRGTGAVRELLLPADTFLTAHFAAPAGGPPKQFAPMPGVWDNGFVIGDPNSYRIALYRWDGTFAHELGRDLPPLHASVARLDEFIGEMKRRAEGRGMKVTDAQLAPMREQGLKEVLPSMTPGSSIRMDAKHRLWVLGMEGDSAFADLFTADRFVGRLHLPCRMFNGYWSVSGTWLALACLPDDANSDLDAVVKLFRISDSGR